jgi:hypothetical protein
MGVAVFSGMLGVTFFGLMLTPLFYVMVRRLSGRALVRAETAAEPPADTHILLPSTEGST